MNPILAQEYDCDLCRWRLAPTYNQLPGLQQPIKLMTCGNRACDNNGVVIVFHSANWNQQVAGEITRFIVPGTKAWDKERQQFNRFSMSSQPDREEQR